MLVRTDNRSVTEYINRLSKVHCRPVEAGCVPQSTSSLRDVHIPGLENREANLISTRLAPLPDEWRLHPKVMEQIWVQFRKAWVGEFVRNPA